MLDILRQPERIDTAHIRTDGGTQPRVGLNPDTIEEYTEAMRNGDQFPPVVLYHDGAHYWLADGYHRLAAWSRYCAGTPKPILADVRQGDRRDAILHSVGANADHGLRRTNDDKRRAVTRLLADDEWSQWSDNEIARRAKVSQPFVSKLRQELSNNGYKMTDESRTATRNGVTYTIDTTNIGKAAPAPAASIPAAQPVDARQPASPAVSAPPSTVFPSGDNKELSPETPRERRIAQAQSLPPKTYNVILADPPWQYNNTGLNGAAANHYDTMSTRDLGGLLWSLGLNIAENAVLFLWVTNPLLEDAFEIINNWGFRYKTNMVWVKDRIGTGFYVRGMHELLLICTKGAMTPIDTGHTPPITSVITAPTQEHSRKPDQVHDLIEQLYPGCNYIELFARRPRQGWDVWGNEVNQ